jgi:hypothetical protein
MAIEALGRLFDLSVGFQPVDMQTAANTGKRVSMRRASGLTVIFFKAIGTGGDDPVITVQEHNAATGGTSQNLAAVDHYYIKSATTPGLVGTETWTRTAQTLAATVTLTGLAASAAIVVLEIEGNKLSDTFNHVSVSVADVGGNAQLGCLLYAPRDLTVQRKPANLRAALGTS